VILRHCHSSLFVQHIIERSVIGTRTAHTTSLPESVKAAYQAGINVLLNITPVLNEYGKERPRTITLDHGAAQAWEAFFNFIESNMGEGKELEPLQDWAGKLPGAALRIAGILAIAERGENTREINEQTMTRALDLAELLITHAKAAFDLMDGDDAQHDSQHIFRWIVEKTALSFKLADVYRENRRFTDAERLNKALKALTARHIISEPMKSGTGGRPSITFEVNPAIFGKE
jgi:putative DNA primase/helicase